MQKFKTWIQVSWKGLFLALFMTVLAFGIQAYVIDLNVILLGFLIGIVAGNMIQHPGFTSGLKFTSGTVLETAIVLLAFQINLLEILEVGISALLIVLVSMSLLLFLTLQLVKRLKYTGSTGYLVGFGTAICGSAAIASLGPLISKDKTEIGIAMATVNILGAVGIFLVPWLGELIFSDDMQTALLLGGSLHAMGHVAGSASLLGGSAGSFAVLVKLVRIALLTPALLIFSKAIASDQETKSKPSKKLPSYLILFIILVVVNSFVELPIYFLEMTASFSTILLAAAMFAIGFGIQLKVLIQEGTKAFVFGLILFALFLLMLIGLIFLEGVF
jgi:uncharacterized integral membrane protein (TIGR00698 family)